MLFIALAISFLLVIADQIIKYFISVHLQPIGTVTVIKNVLNLTYVENRGVAFGMFSDMRWSFVAITSVMILLIIFYLFKTKPKGKFIYISSALIVGGGIGNLIDRIIYGYVIDYLSLSFFPPVCNFADYCITSGVFMLMIYILFFSDILKNDADKMNKSECIGKNPDE